MAIPLLPFLAPRLRRQPVAGAPARLAEDLRETQEHAAGLARLLTAARQNGDIEAARAAAFEQRAERAEGALEQARTQGAELHRDLREVTADRDRLRTAYAGLQRQLDSALGYDEAALNAIESGTGQPRKAASA